MFRVEIKEVKKFNKDNLFRRKHIFHFNNMFEVNDFLNSLRDEYSFIDEGKNKFSYFDYKENCMMRVSVHSCRNTDIPKLKEKEVWLKLYSNLRCLEQSAIFEFCDLDNLKNFIERRVKTGNYEKFPMKEKNLTYFLNKYGDVVYAKRA